MYPENKKKGKYPFVENSFYERIIVEINACRKRARDLRALGNRTCNANWSGDAHAEAHARLVKVCHEQACVDVLRGVIILEMRVARHFLEFRPGVERVAHAAVARIEGLVPVCPSFVVLS